MGADAKGAETLTSFTTLLRNSVLGLLIGGTVALFAYCLHSWQREEVEVRKNLLVQSSFLASASQSFFDNLGNGLKPLGQLLENQGILRNPEASRGLLMEFKNRYPEVASMAVFSAGGKRLISTDIPVGDPALAFSNSPAYFEQLLADMLKPGPYIIGAPEMSEYARHWRYTIRRTVHDHQGRVRFLIQAAIPLENNATFLEQLPIPPKSFIGLLRADGYQQARWPIDDPSAIYGKASEDLIALAVRHNPAAASGYAQDESYWINSDGTRVGVFTRLPKTAMYAYVSAPWRHVWQQWWAHNAAVLLLSLIFLLASAAVALRIWVREKSHRHELVSQARRDSLTGLPNRAAAEDMIQLSIEMSHNLGSKFSVLFLDLDRFKDINDSLGHGLGDLLLIEIADRIRTTLNEEGSVTRFGGDEFLIVLPGCDLETAVVIAERLIRAFAKSFQVRDHTLQASPSIGVVQYPEHGKNLDTLLKHADTAMYEAKRQGRNGFSIYKDRLSKRVLERVEMERMLHQALRENLFKLYYQPVVDMTDGRIVGAEALLRWIRKDGSTVMPKDFIGIAEDSGLIQPLSDWVLRNTLEQIKTWNEAGHSLWVSINISPRQFQDPKLFEKISAALDQSGVPPEQLGIEITESVAMVNPEASTRILSQFRALGVRIAIDDFGTGYSSLSYLKRIPADRIKIDKSFVDGINQEVDDTAIVHTILALADILDKKTIAEGIETESQYNALKNLRCDLAQGYWISRPLPPDDFTAMLERSELSWAA